MDGSHLLTCEGSSHPNIGHKQSCFFRYQVIGPNNVAVPTHFFKVVVGETESRDLELEAFVLPNEAIPDSTPLASFQVNSTKKQGLHTH